MNVAPRHRIALIMFCAVHGAVASGCGPKAQDWQFTGPRVYLIEGTDDERSNGLHEVRDALHAHEVNARVFEYDDWLDIVRDIDADADEEVILVGHGHGAFLATQVVRHYAQSHKSKHIEAIFTIDAYNKDWPHSLRQCGRCDPHERPTAIPVGQNALKVRNFGQNHTDSRPWGSELATTRGTSMAYKHPYAWYENFWTGEPAPGQRLYYRVRGDGIVHETIDNDGALVQRIVKLSRKAALSPFHYTPPEHHPYVAPNQPKPQPQGRTGRY